MEKTRRVFSGTLSEIFGEKVLFVDKIARTIGYRRIAEQSYDGLDYEDKQLLHAYADGVNAYINNVKLLGADSSAGMLPPEFIALGITGKNLDNWHPIDTMALARLMGL
jgi:penicillin amidase